jgi:hypothetical protein
MTCGRYRLSSRPYARLPISVGLQRFAFPAHDLPSLPDVVHCELSRFLTSFPISGSMFRTVADATFNEIMALDEGLCLLTTLSVLELAFNYLSVVPSAFGDLTSLQRLSLQGNRLFALPDSLLDNSSLQYLDVSMNTNFVLTSPPTDKPAGAKEAGGADSRKGDRDGGSGRQENGGLSRRGLVGKRRRVLHGLKTLLCGFQANERVLGRKGQEARLPDTGERGDREVLLSTALVSLSLQLNQLSSLPLALSDTACLNENEEVDKGDSGGNQQSSAASRRRMAHPTKEGPAVVDLHVLEKLVLVP